MKGHGFTLIELLVVIAIIAILAAILFPVFARAREKARQTVCISNVKQLVLAWQMYSQDCDEMSCPGAYWEYDLQPYMKNEGICHCPDMPAQERYGYTMNGWLSGWAGVRGCCPPGTNYSPAQPKGIATVAYPADTFIVMCSFDLLTSPPPYYDYAVIIAPSPASNLLWEYISRGESAGAMAYSIDWVTQWTTPQWLIQNGDIRARHNDGALIGYCDGHAKWMQQNAKPFWHEATRFWGVGILNN
jgi:prepilin-type N-terminal cleavage/methylation domain-containing protein/prepilin-type processing-associated H-X9-DG protein